MKIWVNTRGCGFVIDKMSKQEIADAIGFQLRFPKTLRTNRFILMSSETPHDDRMNIAIIETYRIHTPHEMNEHDRHVRRVMKKWDNLYMGSFGAPTSFHRTRQAASLMANELNKVADELDFETDGAGDQNEKEHYRCRGGADS